MGVIHLEDIKVYAHHGCMEAETVIGSDYRVDLWVAADLEGSALSDDLSDTVDYVLLNAIVCEEMAVPSKLLEHVARRIVKRVMRENTMIDECRVRVAKVNPPVGGHVRAISVELSEKRKAAS
jgi:dihydroneopterin aldolase